MPSGGGDVVAGAKRVADRYLKREVLGEGTYGVVFKAIDTKSRETVAIKRIRLGKYKEGINFTALREIKLLKELKDPNIIEPKGKLAPCVRVHVNRLGSCRT